MEVNLEPKGVKQLEVYISNLEKENEELKKQLEEANEKILLLKASKPMLEYKKTLEENQQKEFIEYLENEIENQKSEIFENSLTSEDIDLYIMRLKLLKCEEILSKYKEIIGGKDE